jgi:hypothetical protein
MMEDEIPSGYERPSDHKKPWWTHAIVIGLPLLVIILLLCGITEEEEQPWQLDLRPLQQEGKIPQHLHFQFEGERTYPIDPTGKD